jgi:hypothetical protein
MRYVYPLDPECPVVAEFMETLFGDPTMAMGAPVEDITEEFERRHRKQCKRCQEYGIRQRVTMIAEIAGDTFNCAISIK